jgi:hypothetical protein
VNKYSGKPIRLRKISSGGSTVHLPRQPKTEVSNPVIFAETGRNIITKNILCGNKIQQHFCQFRNFLELFYSVQYDNNLRSIIDICFFANFSTFTQ